MRETYRFGRVEVRPARRQLWIDGSPAALGARAFDVLIALIERRERVVGKDELLDIVWPDLVVEENNLMVQVSGLRKLLGAAVIATVPGRGYRFTAALDGESTSEPPAPVGRRLMPEPPEPLIGRESDLAALAELLLTERLLSVVGAGGVGKSSVALHLLHQRRGRGDDVLAWVDLTGVSEPALVAGAISGALRLQSPGADALAGLMAALTTLQKPTLVVLDNAEHLIDEVARVALALVGAAPQVQLLVTSQAPLRAAGECVYRLGPLAVPASGTSAADARGHGAVALFVRRAQAADRRFALGEMNVAQVIDICRQLDGMALAIELAAARVTLLGVDALASALGDRLRVLTSGTRGAPSRQQTLRAALEWSHGLLGSLPQQVFRRLGVFSGGFTLELIRQVVVEDLQAGQVPGLDGWAAVDSLGDLVDRSLVVVEGAHGLRYRLLESPRALALERLVEAGEQDAVRQRHAQAVVAHFESVYRRCMDGGIDADGAIDLLAPDLDNARDALAWAIRHDAGLALALTPPMSFALTPHRRSERLRLWESTAELYCEDLPAPLRAHWAWGCAKFWSGRRPALALKWSRIAIDLHRSLSDRMGLYLSLSARVVIDYSKVTPEERAAANEVEALENPAWPAQVRFYGAQALGFIERMEGHHDRALVARERALALALRSGDSGAVHSALANLADMALSERRVDDAIRLGRELIGRLDPARDLADVSVARLNLAAAYLFKGMVAPAREVAIAGWPLAVSFDLQPYWSDYFSLLAALESRWNHAASLCGYADAVYTRFGDPRQLNEAHAAQRAQQLARERLGDAEFERRRAIGAALSDDEAAALAFAPPAAQ